MLRMIIEWHFLERFYSCKMVAPFYKFPNGRRRRVRALARFRRRLVACQH